LPAYKLLLVQQIKHYDQDSRNQSALEMLPSTEEEQTYLHRLYFSDEATFYVCETVNIKNTEMVTMTTQIPFKE